MTEIGQDVTSLDTPVLWVDLDQLEQNIEMMASHFRSAGVQWRPHIKGIKVPAIAHKLLAAGAIGVTCAKLGEAEVMAAAGIRDILIANQIVGRHKYLRLVNLCRQADVKVAVDSTATLADLGQAARDKGVEVGVLLELDSGMHRAGVQPGRPTVELAHAVVETPGLRFDGLMSWEGHVLTAETPDARRQQARESIGLLLESADQCRQAGIPVHIVSCGGSGTADVTPFLAGVTETQAGGAIFSDVTYASWNVPTLPALFVRCTVTSRPAPERIIVDGGFKTMPAWMNPPRPIGVDHVKRVATSAEHGIITLDQPNHEIQVGDGLDFILGYGDSTVFLHDSMYGVRNGTVELIWRIEARGRLR
jgi:D-serine deaminase-like pyridoxal phosphate-dependent protein